MWARYYKEFFERNTNLCHEISSECIRILYCMAAALCFLALGCAGRFTKLLSVLATILVLASAATECQSIEYFQF